MNNDKPNKLMISCDICISHIISYIYIYIYTVYTYTSRCILICIDMHIDMVFEHSSATPCVKS